MDSKVVQSHEPEYDEHHPHNAVSQQVAHGAEEHHLDHEKMSVMNKVRAKAKKIKDTIKNHYDPEYHNEDQHIPDDHHLDEDKQMIEDPEVHGAPIHESAAVKSVTTGQVENLGKSNFGGTTVMGEEPHHEPRVAVVSPTTEINQSKATAPDRTFVGEEKPGQHKVNLERPVDLEEDPHEPVSRPEEYTPPNYQTKVTDRTGAGTGEIDITTPVEKSFSRMNVHDDPKPNPEPEVLPNVAETQYPFNTTKTTVEEQPGYAPMEKSSNKSSCTDKISSATSAIADEGLSTKNAVDSKLGYGEKGDTDDKVTTHEEPNIGDASNISGSTTEYGKKIARSLTDKLAPVYGKVTGAASAVKSKVPGTGTGASTDVETETERGVKEQNKGVSMKDYLAEKLRPSDEDRALSEVISDALHKRKEEPTKAYGDEDSDVTKVISDAVHKREEEPTKASGVEDRDVTKVISDAVHKREDEPEKKDDPRLGKVTESEEVKRRLGGGDEKSDNVSEESHVNSPGKGVVDKLKDAVGSWFGKAEPNQSSQGGGDLSKNSGAEVEQVSQAVGERKLQE